MHYHLEIIMPSTSDVEAAIASIMAAFDEDNEDSRHSFWDWYVIGGRWGGIKIEEILGRDRITDFNEVLVANKITVSGVVCGKQSLWPESQIPLVDQLWNEHFPESPIKTCPLFDNYKGNYGDVMPLSQTQKGMTCARLIIAGPGHSDEDHQEELHVHHMLVDSAWNGVTFQNTTWDRTIESGLASFEKQLSMYRMDYAEKIRPKDDWLCVTVDYHS